MKVETILILSLLVTCIATPSLSKEIKTKLTLFKSFEDHRAVIMEGILCKTFIFIKKDLPRLTDMRNQFCEGEYSLFLDGPTRTNVIL